MNGEPAPSGSRENPDHLLEDFFRHLQILHAESSHMPEEKLVAERERLQLTAHARQIFDARIRHIERWLRKRYGVQDPVSPSGGTEERVEQTVLAIQRKKLEALLAENYLDWTLSTPGHPIYAKKYGFSIFRSWTRSMMGKEPQVEDLQSIGLAFLDGNAIKAMSECTGYDHVTEYLQAVAQIFTNTEGETRQWLDAQNIQVTPMSIGGDEIALLLCGKSPLTPAIMRQIVESYQQEIAESEHLSSFLNFNSRGVLLKFGFPDPVERKQFSTLPRDVQNPRLKDIRRKLPKKFQPSFSGGGATLDEGILELLAGRTIDAGMAGETFDTVRERMFNSMKGLAEKRQSENKQALKKRLMHTDPLSYQLMLRGHESRKMARELIDVRTENTHLRAELENLRAEMQRLLSCRARDGSLD